MTVTLYSWEQVAGTLATHSALAAPYVVLLEQPDTLILDCTECRDRDRIGEDVRTADGTREWTADYRTVPDPERPGFDMREPVNERDVFCPECGALGRVWRY